MKRTPDYPFQIMRKTAAAGYAEAGNLTELMENEEQLSLFDGAISKLREKHYSGKKSDDF